MIQSKRFWEDFASNAHQWSDSLRLGQTRGVFQDINTLLEQHGFSFSFDLTSDECDGILAFTPEGDAEVAEQIDNLVAFAPDLPGWKVYGRRQRKALDDVYAIIRRLFLVDVANSKFQLARRTTQPDVVMFASTATKLTDEEQAALVSTFLDHAMGEELVMTMGVHSKLVASDPPRDLHVLSASEMVTALLEAQTRRKDRTGN